VPYKPPGNGQLGASRKQNWKGKESKLPHHSYNMCERKHTNSVDSS